MIKIINISVHETSEIFCFCCAWITTSRQRHIADPNFGSIQPRMTFNAPYFLVLWRPWSSRERKQKIVITFNGGRGGNAIPMSRLHQVRRYYRWYHIKVVWNFSRHVTSWSCCLGNAAAKWRDERDTDEFCNSKVHPDIGDQLTKERNEWRLNLLYITYLINDNRVSSCILLYISYTS